jgi:hypothetical protein
MLNLDKIFVQNSLINIKMSDLGLTVSILIRVQMTFIKLLHYKCGIDTLEKAVGSALSTKSDRSGIPHFELNLVLEAIPARNHINPTIEL